MNKINDNDEKNKKGIIKIILKHNFYKTYRIYEHRLCQVCRDHPRFRSFFNDREELGLGLCCEAAARLILSFPQKIELLLEEGGTNGAKEDGGAFCADETLDYNQ